MPQVKKGNKLEAKPQRPKLSRAHYSRIGKMGRAKQLAAKKAEKQPEPAKPRKYDTEARKRIGAAVRDAKLKEDPDYYKRTAAKAQRTIRRKAAQQAAGTTAATSAMKSPGQAVRDANLQKDPDYYKKLSAKGAEARKRKAAERAASQLPKRPKTQAQPLTAGVTSPPSTAAPAHMTVNYNVTCEGPHEASGEPTLELVVVGLATLFAVLGTATLVSMKLANMNGLTWEHTTIPGQLLLVTVFILACTTVIRRGYPQRATERS